MLLPICPQCLAEVLIRDGGGVDDDWENQWYSTIHFVRKGNISFSGGTAETSTTYPPNSSHSQMVATETSHPSCFE